MRPITRPDGVVIVAICEASLGRGRGEGRSPIPRQHGMSSDRPSAGRRAVPPPRTTQNESDVDVPRVYPEVNAAASSPVGTKHGGDRRIARCEARGTRVTIRLSSGEADQLARVSNRYRLSESGAIRAAIDYLDGAPPPKVINRDVLRLVAAVNAVGVNVNQLARQGWAGVEPAVDELRRATAQLLELAKGLSE